MELFAEAWNKSATGANAVSGFAKARINSYSEVDFDDEDFLAADVTDMLLPPVAVATTSSFYEGTAAFVEV